MKKSLLALSAAAVMLTGCMSQPSQATSLQQGTAASVYPEALAFAQTQHPDAVLVGFNNHAPSFDRYNLMPEEKDTSGNLSYWSFIFVDEPSAFEDGEVNSEEAFAVEFVPGQLLYAGYVETRDRGLDENSVTGDALIDEDTDAIFNKMVAAITELEGLEPTIQHIDFNMTPTMGEITVFLSETEGYDAIYDYAANDFIAEPRYVNFSSF